MSNKPHSQLSGTVKIIAASGYSKQLYTLVKNMAIPYSKIRIVIDFFEPNYINNLLVSSSAKRLDDVTIFMSYASDCNTLQNEQYHITLLPPEELVICCNNNSPYYDYEVVQYKTLSTFPVVFEQTENIEPLYLEILKKNGIQFKYKRIVSNALLAESSIGDGSCVAPSLAHIKQYYLMKNQMKSFKQIKINPPIYLTPYLAIPRQFIDDDLIKLIIEQFNNIV